MIKVTYKMHSRQKTIFGEISNTSDRTFYGEDEYDIEEQKDEVRFAWYQDPAVQSVRFEEVSREVIEEQIN